MLGEISIDGGLQVGVRAKDAARCRVILEKKVSTALSEEAEVGVKWKVQRGWRASQPSALECLWVA